MESTKSSFLISLVVSLFLLVTTSCNNEKEIIDSASRAASTDPIASKREDALKRAVGTWQLVEIENGWTLKKRPPVKKTEMTIDNSLQVVFYEDSKETSRYQYGLDETPWGIVYFTTKQSGDPSIKIQPKGNFRVSDRELIVGDKGNDGEDYYFQRK